MVRRGIPHPCRGAFISEDEPGVLPPATIPQPSGMTSALSSRGLRASRSNIQTRPPKYVARPRVTPSYSRAAIMRGYVPILQTP